MPKSAAYKVEWSSSLHAYEIIHPPFRFPLTSASWAGWLDMIEAFHFCSPTGYTLTLRKERKLRGTGYWYAYKRVNGQVQKKYLGDKSKLDLPFLEMVARQFVEPEPETAKQEAPPPSPQPTLIFKKTLQSALYIYGFATVPSRTDLLKRYRDLSKRHHPDTGGVHQDMVAVNLAYDYLKKFVDDRQ